MLPVQPSLNYTAPELVHNKNPSAGALSDISSFGCLAYHLVARKPLLDCNNNVKMDPKLSIFDLHAICLWSKYFFRFAKADDGYLEISFST